MNRFLPTVIFNLIFVLLMPLFFGFSSVWVFVGYIVFVSLLEIYVDAWFAKRRAPMNQTAGLLTAINTVWNYLLFALSSAMIALFQFSIVSILVIAILLVLFSVAENFIDRKLEDHAVI